MLWGSWLSTVALASFFACSSSSSPAPTTNQGSQDVTVTWSDQKQSIDGFGASAVFFGGSISDDIADKLFDAKKGLGLSLLRIQVGQPSDLLSDGSEPETDTNPMPTVPEIATAKQALALGCKVWAAAWSPPPVWKTTDSKNGSGTIDDGGVAFSTNVLKTAHYQDFANYLVDFLRMTSAANVPIFALSPANEPDYVATWDNAQWTPQQLTTFIDQNLGPTLSQSFPGVNIVAPETANCPDCNSYITNMMADPMTWNDVPVIAVHGYTATLPVVINEPLGGKSLWQTEWSPEHSPVDTPDPSMKSAIDIANNIHTYMVDTGVNAWNFWAIYITASGLTGNPTRQNPALIQPDATMGTPYMFKRGYAFGNWSKFVRPGFVRIGANDTPVPGVLIEAYRDASHIAVIAVNTTTHTVTQTFHYAGVPSGTLENGVTPWVTSAGDSLVAKSRVPVTDQFTYDLPGNSVVTFVNWDATQETPGEVLAGTDAGLTPPSSSSDAGDAGIFKSPCTASAAGLTLVDDGTGMGTTISFSPAFTPPGCGTVGSWSNFATNSGTIAPSPFTYSPIPPGIPAKADVPTADATVAEGGAGPEASCMSGATGLVQYSTSGIGFNFVQQVAAIAPSEGGASMMAPVDASGDVLATPDATDATSPPSPADSGAPPSAQTSSPGPATLDASSHTGISFWAWGGSGVPTQNVFAVLRDINQTFGFGPAGTPTATGMLCNGGSDGVGTGPTACGGDRANGTVMPGWQLIQIPFTDFVPIASYSSGNGETQIDPSTLTRFELQVQEPSASADAGVPYDLCIYGFSFY
jgi:O-glycosyl hydrolase